MIKHMGIRFGNWDPLQLIFNTLNALIRNNTITREQAREILVSSLPPEMPLEEKNRFVDGLFIRNSNQ